MSRMCSSDVRDFLGAVIGVAVKDDANDEDAPRVGALEADVRGTAVAEPLWWTREKQAKVSPSHQIANDQKRRGSEGFRRAGPRRNSEGATSSSTRFRFGATGDGELPGSDHEQTQAPLESTKVLDPPEVEKTIKVFEVTSKDGDPNKSWKMSIPASFFGEAEEWGRLRDAHVRFEPDRITVEAHDRHGNSKIIHCSNIPRRLVAESSTYKLAPDGKEVQLTLNTVKSPRSEDDILAKEKTDNIESEKAICNKGDGGPAPRSKDDILAKVKTTDNIESLKANCNESDGGLAPFAIMPEKRAGKMFTDAPATPSHFL